MLKGALLTGKICTTVLFLSLILLVMIPEMPGKIVTIIAIIDGIFMLTAFADYVTSYFRRDSDFQSINDTQ